jgi:hypothetical protein
VAGDKLDFHGSYDLDEGDTVKSVAAIEDTFPMHGQESVSKRICSGFG